MTGRAVRETVGLVAVAVSLAFVGFEIRQNTAAVESAAFQALSELQIQINDGKEGSSWNWKAEAE